MDLLRPGAVPALTLLALLSCFAGAAEGCDRLNGVYEYESMAPRAGIPEYLSNFVNGRDRAKIVRSEGGGRPPGFGGVPSGTIARGKLTHLARRARLEYSPQGTRLHFIGAEGAVLADLGIDFPDRWACRGERLERRADRTSGLGGELYTDRVEETLSVDAKGDLVYTETVTRVDPPGGKPRKSEARFRRAQQLG